MLEDRDKYQSLQNKILRTMDASKKFDLEEKLTDLDERTKRELQLLNQLRTDVNNKAQEQRLQLTDHQLRTDV